MGAWGPNIFDNDDASDWVYAFEADGASAVDKALRAATSEAKAGFVEAPTGSAALAAAEAVAFAFGHPSQNLSDEMRAAAEQHGPDILALDDALLKARHAVVAVFGQTADGTGTESELLDLWSADDTSDRDFAAFKAAVTDLALRLKAASA